MTIKSNGEMEKSEIINQELINGDDEDGLLNKLLFNSHVLVSLQMRDKTKEI